jgi:hypothetical protein
MQRERPSLNTWLPVECAVQAVTERAVKLERRLTRTLKQAGYSDKTEQSSSLIIDNQLSRPYSLPKQIKRWMLNLDI